MATQAVERSGVLGARELSILLAARLVLNTAFRLIYPLLVLLSDGFAVSLQTASLLVTVQMGALLLSPLGGALSDRRGERTTMVSGLGLVSVGALICALAPSFWPFLAGYAVIGLGTALFMPAVQAYASNHSPYAERGRVLGILELSWALAAMVGVTTLTQIVARGGWSPAFFVIAAAAVIMLTFCLTLAGGNPGARVAGAGAGNVRSEIGIAAALRAPSVAAMLAFVALQMWAVELIFVSYAAWLKLDFAASTQQLGLIFGLLGVAELGGSLGATLFTDRLGKRRSVLLGFVGMGLFAGLLPLTAGQWGLFLATVLLFDLCFEFGIVSVFPLMSGLGAAARGSVLALTVAASGLGRIAGSLLGPRLFEGAGFWANGTLAAALAFGGVALAWALVREGRA